MSAIVNYGRTYTSVRDRRDHRSSFRPRARSHCQAVAQMLPMQLHLPDKFSAGTAGSAAVCALVRGSVVLQGLDRVTHAAHLDLGCFSHPPGYQNAHTCCCLTARLHTLPARVGALKMARPCTGGSRRGARPAAAWISLRKTTRGLRMASLSGTPCTPT